MSEETRGLGSAQAATPLSGVRRHVRAPCLPPEAVAPACRAAVHVPKWCGSKKNVQVRCEACAACGVHPSALPDRSLVTPPSPPSSSSSSAHLLRLEQVLEEVHHLLSGGALSSTPPARAEHAPPPRPPRRRRGLLARLEAPLSGPALPPPATLVLPLHCSLTTADYCTTLLPTRPSPRSLSCRPLQRDECHWQALSHSC